VTAALTWIFEHTLGWLFDHTVGWMARQARRGDQERADLAAVADADVGADEPEPESGHNMEPAELEQAARDRDGEPDPARGGSNGG
jgi:hypothetical protein